MASSEPQRLILNLVLFTLFSKDLDNEAESLQAELRGVAVTPKEYHRDLRGLEKWADRYCIHREP